MIEMTIESFLFDLGLIIFIGTLLAYVARLLKQPLLVAYLITGILIGPLGLGSWIASMFGFEHFINIAEIQLLAELGIAFLLFTIGLEINFKKLKVVGSATLIGAIIQVFLTFIIGFWFATIFVFGPIISIYIGLLFAFSSTMIVAKILVDKHEITTLHGRIMIGILLVQDILVVPVILLLSNINFTFTPIFLGTILLKVFGLIGVAVLLNKYVFKRILDFAAKTKEIFFFTAVATCFLFIGLAFYLGFPIAIGAFFGGLAMAKFPYNIEIFGEMRSLRDFFSVIFFASLGIQLNLGFLYTFGFYFIILLLAIVLIKPVILFLTYLSLGYGGRTSSAVGLGLGQGSEFTFIIALQGLALGHFASTPNMYSLILSLVVFSIIITPYFLRYHYSIYGAFAKIKFLREINPFKQRKKLGLGPKKKFKNHIVVFGCGTTGAIIIKYLQKIKRDFMVLEHDPEIVKTLNKTGIYCLYGEADNVEILERLGLFKAKLAIIAIPDLPEACFAIRKAKEFNAKIKILARATTAAEKEKLQKAGADIVIIPKVVSAYSLTRKIGKLLK